MSTLVHGIELDEEGNPAWLRFGILRLLYKMYFTNAAGPSVQDWLQRLHSMAFRHQVSHFQQCFSKFDRAAGHAARCRDAVDPVFGRYNERISRGETVPLEDSDRLAMDEANADLPLFLDAMLFYLRIQADAYAKLMPDFFYQRPEAKYMPSDSFRKHLTWFTEKMPDFDPAYASILKANHKWFDRLAGRHPKGLRDVVIHQSGMLAVGWTKPEDGPIEPRTALYRSSGVVEENVFGALQEITAGWYAFLDAAWHLFVPRLTETGVLLTMSVNDLERTRYFDCGAGEARGLWVYPRAS